MAYTPNTWQSIQGQGLNRFQDQDGNIYYLTAIPEQVTQPGTPFSADWMNHIEQGIADNDTAIQQNISDISQNSSDITQNTNAIQQNTSDIASIQNKLNGYADFVVEQTQSGKWTYRKWNSGIVDLWYNDPTSLTFSGYGTSSNIYFPFALTSVNNIQVTLSGGYMISVKVNSFNTNYFSILFWSDSEISNVPQNIFVNINGTWK